jgi:hypothetical protein
MRKDQNERNIHHKRGRARMGAEFGEGFDIRTTRHLLLQGGLSAHAERIHREKIPYQNNKSTLKEMFR